MDDEIKQLTKKERKALAKEQKRQEREKQEKTGKLKKLAIVIIILGTLGFGGYKLFQWINTPTENVSLKTLSISSDDWVKGNREATVVLYEFSDFQCPACKAYYPILNQIADEFGDSIALVFNHFPLDSIHKNSRSAAYASEAAGVQGKFWEMHDILFDKQDEWASDSNPEEKFIIYAQELELDVDKFKSDMGSDRVKEIVNKDWEQAFALGLNSTPSIFINNEKVQPNSYEGLKSLIEKAISSTSNNQS